MDLPFHFRALDDSGATIRQSTVAFPTVEAAQAAADRATRIHGDDHVVCISLDPKDKRNNAKDPLRNGFKVYEPETDSQSEPEPKAKAKKK